MSLNALARGCAVGLVALLTSCESAYPEVIVVNTTDQRIVLRDISFLGCLWNDVLSFGEATSPQRCPPGSDRVRFKKFDAGKYCQQQAEEGALEGICACDGGVALPATVPETGSTNKEPLWFNYQTLSEHTADYGDFLRIELAPLDLEQDFAIPGPYGH